jgi:hypothetical protein
MKETKSNIVLILVIISLCISVVSLVLVLGEKKSSPDVIEATTEVTTEEGDIQYVLYLGTNDKDTNEPVYSPEEAKSVLKNILISQMGGYTIQEANGGWKDDEGTEYQEYTLVIYLSDTTIEDVHKLCDELIDKYNQSSILIQQNKTTTEFYSK